MPKDVIKEPPTTLTVTLTDIYSLQLEEKKIYSPNPSHMIGTDSTTKT